MAAENSMRVVRQYSDEARQQAVRVRTSHILFRKRLKYGSF